MAKYTVAVAGATGYAGGEASVSSRPIQISK